LRSLKKIFAVFEVVKLFEIVASNVLLTKFFGILWFNMLLVLNRDGKLIPFAICCYSVKGSEEEVPTFGQAATHRRKVLLRSCGTFEVLIPLSKVF
jgi:hypothetical protein